MNMDTVNSILDSDFEDYSHVDHWNHYQANNNSHHLSGTPSQARHRGTDYCLLFDSCCSSSSNRSTDLEMLRNSCSTSPSIPINPNCYQKPLGHQSLSPMELPVKSNDPFLAQPCEVAKVSQEDSLLPTSQCQIPYHQSSKDAINRISPQTMVELIYGQHLNENDRLMVIDCRYPYEYLGGHIPNAINVCSLAQIDRMLFNLPPTQENGNIDSNTHNTVIVFHCEFSSERAPRMALHVRNKDRCLNSQNYPHLHYPRIFILDGGYKQFYLGHPSHCDPPNQYVPMRNANNREELKFHQSLKYYDGQSHGKHRHKLRSNSLKSASQNSLMMATNNSSSSDHANRISDFFFGSSKPCPVPPRSSSVHHKTENTNTKSAFPHIDHTLLSSDLGETISSQESNIVLLSAEESLLSTPHQPHQIHSSPHGLLNF